MNEFETGYPLGWLSPEGELIECRYTEHLEKAREIVQQITKEDMPLADEYLLGHGWVHLTELSALSYGWAVIFPYSDKLTLEQHRFLKPYVEKYINFLAEGFITNLAYEFPDLFSEFYEDLI